MLTRQPTLSRSIICSLLATTLAMGQDNAGGDADLAKEVKELKSEVQAMRAELKSLRSEINKAVVAMRTAGGQPTRQRQRPAMTMVGQKAPFYKVTSIDGQERTIGGKRDKPQVLFAYASWCGFCKKSLPWMEKVHKKYEDKGVEVLLLNLDARGEGGRARTEEQTLDTYKQLNLTMPMAMTTASNDTAKIGAAYKARSFPTLFVLGPSGEVESVHIGAKQGLEDTISKEIDVLLDGKNREAFPKS